MGWAGGSIVGTDTFSYALDIKSKRRLDEAQETIGLWAEATRDADTFSLLRLGLGAGRPAVSIRDLGACSHSCHPPTKSAILRKCGWAPVHV